MDPVSPVRNLSTRHAVVTKGVSTGVAVIVSVELCRVTRTGVAVIVAVALCRVTRTGVPVIVAVALY
jgi:hypothetical protein